MHTNMRRGVHWQAIETGGTGRGIPDSNFCIDGVEGWVEHKQTEAWSVGLSPEQVGWHLTRWSRGGWTLVAIRRWHDGGPRKGDPVDELWIYEGQWAAVLATQGLKTTAPALGIWEGGPARWDWEGVRSILGGGRRPVLGEDAGAPWTPPRLP